MVNQQDDSVVLDREHNKKNKSSAVTRKSIVLIVDDNEYGRDILRRLLITKGYQLAFAANGVEALAKAAQLTPDLILLDVMMPGMDGFEVCRRLRKDPILSEVPIIMLTALDEPHARVQGLEAGADDFITKPFDRDELRARVQTIIRLNRFRRLLLERTKFEWVVENADDGYLIIDENDYVLYTNPRAQLYLELGVNPNSDESSVETFLTIAKKQYQQEPKEAWRMWPNQTEAQQQNQRYLLRPESKSAPAFWLQVDILNLTEADENRIVRLRDVTEQMNQERDMRGFHEMIRHKMATPLLLMLQNLEFLAKYAPKMTSEQMVESAEKALKNGKRLHDQVQDILQYLHTPRMIDNGAGFPLAKLGRIIQRITTDIQVKSFKILGQDGLGGVRFFLSEETMEVILTELLENSHKFHPTHTPTITIYVSRAGIDKINIQVCDDGIHLSPEQLANVWDPYYQAEKHFTGEVGGMGLGLTGVAMVVKQANGTYRITNRKEQSGVVVEFTLPIEETWH